MMVMMSVPRLRAPIPMLAFVFGRPGLQKLRVYLCLLRITVYISVILQGEYDGLLDTRQDLNMLISAFSVL